MAAKCVTKTIKRKRLCLREVASSATKAKRRARGKWLQRNFRCQRGTKGRFTKCYEGGRVKGQRR